MASPCVLITSCSDFSPENIVKDILKVESLAEGESLIESIVSYEWSIDTKYYTADVRLCVTKERTIGDQDFADSVQAFIVYFDADKKETFSSVQLWKSYLKEIDPEIKILVCDRCIDSSAVGRLEAQKWCIDNGFELVELNPEPVDSDSDIEDDFVETTGIKRIVQSLHAHTWPNLTIKDSRHSVSPFMRQLMKEEHESKKLDHETDKKETPDNNQCSTNHSTNDCEQFSDFQKFIEKDNQNNTVSGTADQSCDIDSNTGQTTDQGVCQKCGNKNVTCGTCGNVQTENIGVKEDNEKEKQNGACGDSTAALKEKSEKSSKKVKQPTKEERLDSLLPAEDMSLFEALGCEDPGGESFEKLFERFAKMKERAAALPFEERKKYAENVAVAFWKAIGGDEDEIGDLDSD